MHQIVSGMVIIDLIESIVSSREAILRYLNYNSQQLKKLLEEVSSSAKLEVLGLEQAIQRHHLWLRNYPSIDESQVVRIDVYSVERSEGSLLSFFFLVHSGKGHNDSFRLKFGFYCFFLVQFIFVCLKKVKLRSTLAKVQMVRKNVKSLVPEADFTFQIFQLLIHSCKRGLFKKSVKS